MKPHSGGLADKICLSVFIREIVCLFHSLTDCCVSSALSCKPPPTDGRVIVKGLPENDNPILPDRFLTFSCEGPGIYLNGSSALICGKDGQWDNPFPTCDGKLWKFKNISAHNINVILINCSACYNEVKKLDIQYFI